MRAVLSIIISCWVYRDIFLVITCFRLYIREVADWELSMHQGKLKYMTEQSVTCAQMACPCWQHEIEKSS